MSAHLGVDVLEAVPAVEFLEISDIDGIGTTQSVGSWDEIVRAHRTRVYRTAYRLTGNSHDAEDLTQDVFVRVFRALPQFSTGSFEGWLYRITTNLFLDQVRRKTRIRFDSLGDDEAERVVSRDATPSEVVVDASMEADVQAALDALLPQFRIAVVLCDIEGLTYEEIAEVLSVKLGTVRSRIHRGRAMLRESLAHRAPKTGTATRMPLSAVASTPPSPSAQTSQGLLPTRIWRPLAAASTV